MLNWERVGIFSFFIAFVFFTLAFAAVFMREGAYFIPALVGGFSLAWILFEVGVVAFSAVTLLVYGPPLERGERIQIISGPHQDKLAVVKNQSSQLIVAVIENDPAQGLIVLKRGDIRRAAKAVL